MANRSYEFSAKSAEEAIEEGLRTLGLTRDAVTRDAVTIEIINRGSRGILGFGSEPAVVRLTVADTDPGPLADQNASTPAAPIAATSTAATDMPVGQAEEAQKTDSASASPTVTAGEEKVSSADSAPSTDIRNDTGDDDSPDADNAEEADNEGASDEEMKALAIELLSQLIELMGFDAKIVASWEVTLEDDGSPYLNLDIQGEDLGILIGRRGETLANLQFLLRLMVNQRLKTWKNIVIDVEQYKQRRIDQLTHLANRMAEQVATSGRAVSLEPMPANERRIIHIALRENPAVYTDSTGEGERRKITIAPR